MAKLWGSMVALHKEQSDVVLMKVLDVPHLICPEFARAFVPDLPNPS